MAQSDRDRLAGRTTAQYDGFGYNLIFAGDMNSVAAVGYDMVAAFTAAQAEAANAAASANAASSSLAGAQAITGGVQGVGTAFLMVPRNAELLASDPAPWPIFARGAAYQITPHDSRRVLIAETGTLTWTLPISTDLDLGWQIRVWNRSGNNLTINRSGTAVIGAAATSLTIADGAGALLAYRNDTRFERIA